MDLELHDPNMDLLDEGVFETYIRSLQSRKFDASLMSMPSSSFSPGPGELSSGCYPLRGIGDNDIYGLPGLSLEQKEIARVGTILALRGASVAELCLKLGLPWICFTPMLKEGHPSVLLLPEWKAIIAKETVKMVNIVQGELGLPTQKGTAIWGTASLHDLPEVCDHPYHPSMFPPAMNRELAFRLLMTAGLKGASRTCTSQLVRSGYWANSLVRSNVRVSDDEYPYSFQAPPRAFDIKVTRAIHARLVH